MVMNLLRYSRTAIACGALILWHPIGVFAEDREIDASDPTRVYSYFGGGVKYSDYTNGESMTELRITGNWGIDDNDMILFEAGYGWHSGSLVAGSNQDVTDARVRYFHLFGMNYDLQRGYRGSGLNLDLQLAGSLKGTNGQNTVAFGLLPAWALGDHWNLYMFANAVGTWDRKFEKFNGAGVQLAPQVVYDPSGMWAGAQFKLMLDYKYFLSGELQNDGSGTVELNIGGEFTPIVTWDVIAQKFFDVDLRTLRRGIDTGLENDWNVFFNVTRFF